MNKENSNPDAKLSSLLRESRAAPALPPRFHDNVWRRIADAETKADASSSWFDALMALVSQPRLAFAALTVLVLAGAAIGARDGIQLAHRDAEARYVASVAPNPLR